MSTFPRPVSRFAGAVVAAPLAGGLAAFVATFITFLVLRKANEPIFPDGARVSWMLAFWATLICLAYVLVLGTLAYVYTRVTRRSPHLAVAIVVGLAAGVTPFAIPSFGRSESLGSMMSIPLLAAICAVATAWTFGRVALSPAAATE